MNSINLTTELKSEARRLGFDLAGVCPAVAPAGITRFRRWLDNGYAGEMHYLSQRADAYEHPRHVLDGVRSILMLAMNYATVSPQPAGAGQGQISRYAWGDRDYHDLIHQRLKSLQQFLVNRVPDAKLRGVVDTAPLLEREFAQLAGLGWIGKNTLLINKRVGSWFFLAALLTDVELDYDEPHAADHCGTCRACLDACPTNAFPEPYVLDATRCISYLTIELRAQVPAEQRSGVGQWLFGCDVCQDVCPWNHRAPTSGEAAFVPKAGADPVDLTELFLLDDAAFRRRFRDTPLWRSKRRGILRNAALALANRPTERNLDALIHGLNDQEPLVRGASAWAIGHYQQPSAGNALRERLKLETNDEVRREIAEAIGNGSIQISP